MKRNQPFIPARLKPWIEARQKFGKLANRRQERWKRPLPDFIAHLYVKNFGELPDVVRTIEEVAAAEMARGNAISANGMIACAATHGRICASSPAESHRHRRSASFSSRSSQSAKTCTFRERCRRWG